METENNEKKPARKTEYCSSCRQYNVKSDGDRIKDCAGRPGMKRRICALCVKRIDENIRKDVKAGRKKDPRKWVEDVLQDENEYEQKEYLRKAGF